MKSHHLHNVEHNLYLSALLGHTSAKLTMGYLLKEGIGMQKNCSVAAAYYLSAIRSTKIESLEYPSEYDDATNFEKQLYTRTRADLAGYG
jgi:hypothetical protein